METQAPAPPNPGQLVDDPVAPLRLQPVEQISDFWKRYDRLADIHDKTLTSNLNGNLDVLLIFAALFSAINTAFISITMPDLSPSPSDETNTLLRLLVMRADNNTLTPTDLSPAFSANSTSIIVNCLLYASLSCSLLAAVGAMMAKEWLQSFNRSGQTGPLEDQGKLRQRKFNGVEQWHLEAVIKFLPNLLLLSVILFFAGIGLFLFPINTAVAGTVIAFSGLGVILSGIAIVAGAISPLCPYQSAASNAVRRISGVLYRSWMLSRTIVHRIFRTISRYSSTISVFIILLWMQLSRIIHRSTEIQAVSAEALSLTSIESRLTVPGSTDPSSIDSTSVDSPEHSHVNPSEINNSLIHRVFARLAEVFASLIGLGGKGLDLIFTLRAWWQNVSARMGSRNQQSETTQKLEASEQTVIVQAGCWLLQTTSNRGDQVAAAQFIRGLNKNACTLAFEDSRNWRRILSLTCEALDIFDSQASEGNREVAAAFGLALCHVSLPFPEDMFKGEKENAPDSMSLQKARSLSEVFLYALDLARAKYEKEDEERVFHLAFMSTLIGRGPMIQEYQWMNLSQLFPVDENPRSLIADNLLGMWAYGAARESGGYLRGIDKLEELMEIGGNTAREYARQSPNSRHDFAARGMFNLLLNYYDPMTASDSGHTPVELVKLSIEAVLGFRDFLDTKANENGSSVVVTSESEQLLDHHFVAAVADILMYDPVIFISSLLKAESVKASIIRILLWVWKNMSEVSMSNQERRNIFLLSCRLWEPLEEQVEFSRRGKVDFDHKRLTPEDLKRITEFIDYLRKDRDNSEFISRNADVGINRLHLPFEQEVDWKYELFDFSEPRKLCCRSSYSETELL
ncbi:hypothetical protein FS837_009475 [Tulasnella sp. UAMH 9824]|nr:hypothetical protein FS837_009475 [Tulasnella sp. UAMH 9824]